MINPQACPNSVDKQECEATHCDNVATTQLDIPVGKIGYLSIFVCDTCVKKFGIGGSQCADEIKQLKIIELNKNGI